MEKLLRNDKLLVKLFLTAAVILLSILPILSYQYSTPQLSSDGNTHPEDHSHLKFCHVNNFSVSNDTYKMEFTRVNDLTVSFFAESMNLGRPFVVSGVTHNWRANSKWDSDYFRNAFSNFELFSSTFATNTSPMFDNSGVNDRYVYYGIFLNDRSVADLIADDYIYPNFIPSHLRMQGMHIHVGELL